MVAIAIGKVNYYVGVSRSDEYAERVLAIVRPHYLVKLAVAGAVAL